ncbi:MAG: diguanylate cyclase [Lachnospiraceae bacterium]|jgi:diguanylate cyclase (GGDEF)-like protein/PAS domain S-box-containing protein|nr:diguanylate cyclase [Lachnospiraceae bacterium]
MDKESVANSIDNSVGQFNAESSIIVDDEVPLFDMSAYPEDMHKLIAECNKRIDEANSKYRTAKYREDMFAKGLKAGMYYCTFDRDENMLSFEFNDETRQMLGYDGLEDLPNEFDSWVKTLVPEERDAIVKLFWDSVRIHRELPDITHATYRMQKKDGSIIWVTGAGRFIRRPDDGSLEVYMGCYRDITAQQELEEHLKIIEAIGKIFNFSLFIDVSDMSYRIISKNKYVDMAAKDPDAMIFLKNNVASTVAESFRPRLYEWLDKDKILAAIEEHGTTSMEFYSEGAQRWFEGIFMVGDRNEDGSLAHIVYGCQDTTEAKLQNLAQQKKISEFETEVYIDSLSKVRNRRFLDDKLIYEPCKAVVMSDIDLFKNINDTAGHQGGDQIIRRVAELLEDSVRKEDVVIRYGGDEFMMVFFDITKKSLENKLSGIKSELRNIKIENYEDLPITMSFGAAFGTELVSNMIKTADKALYESKKVRNTYTISEL